MADLLKEDENICDFSLFNGCRNSPKRWIHDKNKIRYIHGDARILEVVNKELKMVRCGVGAVGGVATATAYSARVARTVVKPGKTFKVGKKTGAGLATMGAALSVADGIMGIIDAATATMPQERCSQCSMTFNTAGCMAKCIGDGGCRGECHLNNWKDAKPTEVGEGKEKRTIYGCYHICESCFKKLIGS